MRSFTCNAPVRLHDGAAAFGGGERILVLLKELLYLSRDPAPGGSRQLEDSRRGGERRPLAAQAHSATGHGITLPGRSSLALVVCGPFFCPREELSMGAQAVSLRVRP